MSFFNLTHMGYENTIAESLEQKTTGAAEGSHVKYTALKTKHTRSDKGEYHAVYSNFDSYLDYSHLY